MEETVRTKTASQADSATTAGTRLSADDIQKRLAKLLLELHHLAIPDLQQDDGPRLDKDSPAELLMLFQKMIRWRRLRDRFFPSELFADPAWDILLDLTVARLAGKRVSVSSLCVAASVPSTTALRWIKQLLGANLLVRMPDMTDRRRQFIEISDATFEKMMSYARSCR